MGNDERITYFQCLMEHYENYLKGFIDEKQLGEYFARDMKHYRHQVGKDLPYGYTVYTIKPNALMYGNLALWLDANYDAETLEQAIEIAKKTDEELYGIWNDEKDEWVKGYGQVNANDTER